MIKKLNEFSDFCALTGLILMLVAVMSLDGEKLPWVFIAVGAVVVCGLVCGKIAKRLQKNQEAIDRVLEADHPLRPDEMRRWHSVHR